MLLRGLCFYAVSFTKPICAFVKYVDVTKRIFLLQQHLLYIKITLQYQMLIEPCICSLVHFCCKLCVKKTSKNLLLGQNLLVENFTYILRADFALIFFHQKITKPSCKLRKAAQN